MGEQDRPKKPTKKIIMATVHFWPNSRNTTSGHTDSRTNGQPTIDNAARQLFNCPKKKA